MVLKFTTDPQYSFTIINHFGNTSSPIIIKKTAFFILYYCYGSNILCQNVHMVSWYMRKYGNFCSNTTAPFCPHNLFDNQFFGPPPRRFDQPVTVWSCFSPTFLSMKINLEKKGQKSGQRIFSFEKIFVTRLVANWNQIVLLYYPKLK